MRGKVSDIARTVFITIIIIIIIIIVIIIIIIIIFIISIDCAQCPCYNYVHATTYLVSNCCLRRHMWYQVVNNERHSRKGLPSSFHTLQNKGHQLFASSDQKSFNRILDLQSMIVHTISQTKTFDVQQLEKIRKPAKQNVLVQYDNSTMHQEFVLYPLRNRQKSACRSCKAIDFRSTTTISQALMCGRRAAVKKNLLHID